MVITRVTGKVKGKLAVLLPLSVTFTVKVESIAVRSGVPDKTPAVVRLSQAGRPVADQLYPPAPPEAANVWL